MGKASSKAPYLYLKADDLRGLIVGKTFTIKREIRGTNQKNDKGAQPNAAIKSKSGKLNVSHLGVFLLIAAHMDKNKGAFPSLAELGKLGQCDPRTIGDKVEELEAAGLVEVIRSKKPDGSNQVNRYRIQAELSISQYEKRYEHAAVTMYRAMLGGDPAEGFISIIAEINPDMREWGGTLQDAQRRGYTADQSQQVIALYRLNLKNSIQPSNTLSAVQAQPEIAPVKPEVKALAPVTPASIRPERVRQAEDVVQAQPDISQRIRKGFLPAAKPPAVRYEYVDDEEDPKEVQRQFIEKTEREYQQRQEAMQREKQATVPLGEVALAGIRGKAEPPAVATLAAHVHSNHQEAMYDNSNTPW